jgi:hypothetical protein
VNERSVLILKLVSSHIALPVLLTAATFWIRGNAFLVNVITQTVVLIIFFAGYWEFFGLRFRRVFLALFEFVLVLQLADVVLRSHRTEVNIPPMVFLSLVEAFLIIRVVRIFIVRYAKDPLSVEILFPLHDGPFLITDGGNSRTSRLMNYHYYSPMHKRNHTNQSMLYATDIVKIANSYPSFLPRVNSDYPIFGEPVFAPIDGTVVKVENGIRDNQPYGGKYPYNTGNTVVIRRDSSYLLIGHLQQGSVSVHVGEQVSAGQIVARAGNSGLSERPHIHMQLTRSTEENFWRGTGVCMVFKGMNLYKNRILRT